MLYSFSKDKEETLSFVNVYAFLFICNSRLDYTHSDNRW